MGLRIAHADIETDLLNPNVDAIGGEHGDHPTLDQLTASSRNKAQKDASTLQSAIEQASEDHAAQQMAKPTPGQSSQQSVSSPKPAEAATGGAAELEDQADQEGALNPVTGEINWDCPCLGGMAYGPCGEEFRAAFSCFVYSTQEPKGMECIDKFQGMQDCFRKHPEVYQGEIDDEDNEALDDGLATEREELRKEIEERRSTVQGKQDNNRRNLLDVSEPEVSKSGPATDAAKAAESKLGGKKSSTSTTKSQSSNTSSKSSSQPAQPAKTTSHTPDEYSQKKETEHGAASQTVSDRKAPDVRTDAVPETDTLVPKAAHDATDTTSQDTESRAQ